jgi:hypothetical protein
MGQSDYSLYNTQPFGSPAPLLWFASLPKHVQTLYNFKSDFAAQPALMVILAEVVCEAFTVSAFEELFTKKHMEKLWGALSSKRKIRRYQDICNDDINGIYTALSGDAITEAPFWQQLKRHNDRRNALVHPDHPPSAAHPIPSQTEAEESFKAVEAYIQHVQDILKSIQP